MHTLLHPALTTSRLPPAAEPSHSDAFREPKFDCRYQPDAVRLTVFVPGVAAGGVDIESSGPDLVVTARKAHVVRVNFSALHLETVQRDYQLRLRLGHSVNFAAMHAEIHDGVLHITVPKRAAEAARRVA